MKTVSAETFVISSVSIVSAGYVSLRSPVGTPSFVTGVNLEGTATVPSGLIVVSPVLTSSEEDKAAVAVALSVDETSLKLVPSVAAVVSVASVPVYREANVSCSTPSTVFVGSIFLKLSLPVRLASVGTLGLAACRER